MPRFASVTEEEAREIEAGKNAVRTKKATEVMTNVLKEYIKEKKIAINLETASQQTVNQLLEMFYFEVRKNKCFQEKGREAVRNGSQAKTKSKTNKRRR